MTLVRFLAYFWRCAPLLVAGSFYVSAVSADVQATDDTGQVISLAAPARRIVSLAPHVTELLFAIGAGSRVVATVRFSDYPVTAMQIPRIGGSSGIDVERIVALKPDLIVGWASGNPRRVVEQLKNLGFALYLTEPKHLEGIANDLERLGELTGTSSAAHLEAERFNAAYRSLQQRYANRPRIRVFYQVLDPQLITVSGQHLISEIIAICGGQNIFSTLPVIAPVVSEEAVLAANPDVLVGGGTEENWRVWLKRWQQRPELTAVKNHALYFVSADTLHRHTPRILQGAEQLCVALDDARRRLKLNRTSGS